MASEQINKIDALIDQCIEALADDSVNQGANALLELAILYGKSGTPRAAFNNIRMYIIREAQKLDQCPKLIEMKLKLAEQELRKMRNNERPKSRIIH
jgi:hypothetical protein